MNKKSSQSISTRRQEQKAQTRLLILESARVLFEKQGYERTTMRQVASHAGVGLGTIFAHFPDKAALLTEALHENLETAMDKALTTVPHKAGIREQFLHVACALYDYYAQKPELGRVLIKNILFIPPSSRHAMDEMDSQFFDLVSQVVEHGKVTGEISTDVDCMLAAESFFASYIYVLVKWLSKPVFDSQKAKNELRLFLDQIFTGIGTVGNTSNST